MFLCLMHVFQFGTTSCVCANGRCEVDSVEAHKRARESTFHLRCSDHSTTSRSTICRPLIKRHAHCKLTCSAGTPTMSSDGVLQTAAMLGRIVCVLWHCMVWRNSTTATNGKGITFIGQACVKVVIITWRVVKGTINRNTFVRITSRIETRTKSSIIYYASSQCGTSSVRK